MTAPDPKASDDLSACMERLNESKDRNARLRLEIATLKLALAAAAAAAEQARIITELRQLRDAVGKLKDANVTGAVERAYAAASEVKETKP